MIVSIHQPNFFPWLGYFRKIQRSDVFVFLDDVPFTRTGSTWTNRVKLLVAGEPRWITCPLERVHGGGPPIHELRIDNSQPWRKRLLATLQANYARAPHYAASMAWLEPLIARPVDHLSEYNIAAVTEICRRLGIGRRLVSASELPGREAWAELTGSHRLAALCRTLGATTYVAGDGSSGYEDEVPYQKQGISLIYNKFEGRTYVQAGKNGEFSFGLSVLDAIFNVGLEETGKLLFA